MSHPFRSWPCVCPCLPLRLLTMSSQLLDKSVHSMAPFSVFHCMPRTDLESGMNRTAWCVSALRSAAAKTNSCPGVSSIRFSDRPGHADDQLVLLNLSCVAVAMAEVLVLCFTWKKTYYYTRYSANELGIKLPITQLLLRDGMLRFRSIAKTLR